MALINYGLRYRLEYTDIQGNTYLCELQKRGYQGESEDLEGNVILKHKAVDSVFTPIRSTALSINLYASVENPLNEFDVIEEFVFKVKFYRNGLQIFEGWVNPDGIFQDFVRNEWVVTLTAVDGLGALKNLEFAPGFLGKEFEPQEGNYLIAIFLRLNYFLPFALFDDINVNFTLGNPSNQEFFSPLSRIINRDVFKNKNGRFFSCEVVLSDILAKYNFYLVQQNVNGRLCWLLCRLPFLLSSGSRKGSIFSVTNIDLTTEPYATLTIVKEDNFVKNTATVYSDALASSENLPIHCNENQQFSFAPALQNFRFSQKWLGLLNKNRPLDDFSWDLTSRGEFVEDGIRVDITGSTLQNAAFQTLGTGYTFDDPAKIIIEFKSRIQNFGTLITNPANRVQNLVRVRAEAFLTGLPTLYLFKDEGTGVLSWRDTPYNLPLGVIYVANQTEWFQNVVLEAPELSNVIIYIDLMETVRTFAATNSDWRCVYTDVNIFFDNPLFGEGVFHDSKRIQNRSTFLKEPISVINSNDGSNLFLNNIYRKIGDTNDPINNWKSVSQPTPLIDLLELTSKERVTTLQKPQKIFRGDVYGFVPYFSLLTYDGIQGNFSIIEYSFDTAENITTIESQQIFDDAIGIDYEKSFIFENEVNVLIRS
jgi:hypothetical protein